VTEQNLANTEEKTQQKIQDARQFTEQVRASAGQALQLSVLRGTAMLDVVVTPTIDATTKFARIGVQLPRPPTEKLQYAGISGVLMGAQKTWDLTLFSYRMIGKLLFGQLSLKHISGPVTIADYAGKSAQMGAVAFISFLALISISLGVMNLLPIPVLDGGHLLYYLAEIVRGKALPESWQENGQRIGFAVLGCLMAVALFNDLLRTFT
jgi:regulator of sigma E protease